MKFGDGQVTFKYDNMTSEEAMQLLGDLATTNIALREEIDGLKRLITATSESNRRVMQSFEDRLSTTKTATEDHSKMLVQLRKSRDDMQQLLDCVFSLSILRFLNLFFRWVYYDNDGHVRPTAANELGS